MSPDSKGACPNCHAELMPVRQDGATVDECMGCKGIWVDFTDEKEFLKIRAEVFTVDELKRLHREYKPLGVLDPVKFRKCPVCGELMYRRNWGGHSGVIVDRCERHGNWFDPGEPEKIREYIIMGGVEYEKLSLTERGLTELRDRLIKKTDQIDQRLIANRHGLARWWTAIDQLSG